MTDVKPWPIEWYVCTADSSDVAYSKTQGKIINVGDELWRVPYCIGPIGVDNNHWAGDHIDADDEVIHLAASAPVLLHAVKQALADPGNLTDQTRRLLEEALAIAENTHGS